MLLKIMDTLPPKQRFRPVPLRFIVPNCITLLSIAAGVTAIRMAIEGRLETALLLILLAAFFDMIDGRIARLMKGQSRFGAELDSLADFVNFGVSPALILYFWQLKMLGSLGWAICLVFAICVCLRLARFNVAIDDPNKPAWMGNFFAGMPSPAGGICVLLPIYFDFLGLSPTFLHPPVVAAYMLVIAGLMISTLPVFSGKNLKRVPRDKIIYFLIGIVLLAWAVFAHTWLVMSILVLLYLALLPYSYVMAKRAAQASAPQTIA
jgi:CDP-diacylglycerol---serine O-phosphatidyltransferase